MMILSVHVKFKEDGEFSWKFRLKQLLNQCDENVTLSVADREIYILSGYVPQRVNKVPFDVSSYDGTYSVHLQKGSCEKILRLLHENCSDMPTDKMYILWLEKPTNLKRNKNAVAVETNRRNLKRLVKNGSSKCLCPRHKTAFRHKPTFEPGTYDIAYPTSGEYQRPVQISDEALEMDSINFRIPSRFETTHVGTAGRSESPNSGQPPAFSSYDCSLQDKSADSVDTFDANILIRLKEADSRLPEYPSYSGRRSRFSSFHCWESSFQNPERFAEIGFFHTGTKDFVRCFCCGVFVSDWKPDDEPLFVHLRNSPDCQYLRIHLGEELFNLYKSNLEGDSSLPTDSHQIQQQYSQAVGGSNAVGGFSSTEPNRRDRRDSDLLTNIRSPANASYNVRLSTFSKWPADITQTPAILAEAGFYYTGMNDIVRCYGCDGGLQHWDVGDDPWIEHARWFPECPHVRQVKGEDYIAMVQMSFDNSDTGLEYDPEPLSDEGIGNFSQLSLQPSSGESFVDVRESKETKAPEWTRIEKRLIERGYDKRDVLKAVEECIQTDQTISTAGVISIIESNQKQKIESLVTHTANPEEAMLAERARLRSIVLCILCERNNANILFLPCAHHCMCEECAGSAEICPLCTKKIEQTMRTFMG